MTLYDIMYKAITEKYENGEITFEQANELNELAYDRYTTETSEASKEKRDSGNDTQEKPLNEEELEYAEWKRALKRNDDKYSTYKNGAKYMTDEMKGKEKSKLMDPKKKAKLHLYE